MIVTMTMPEGHAILHCGAALDCIGEVAAARTAQAITASGETRRPAVADKIQHFKFGGDGDLSDEKTELPQQPSKRQDKKTMLHLCHRPMFRCQIRYLQKHPMKMLKRHMMIVRTLLNLSRTALVHIGNGVQSTKCPLQNLMILG